MNFSCRFTILGDQSKRGHDTPFRPPDYLLRKYTNCARRTLSPKELTTSYNYFRGKECFDLCDVKTPRTGICVAQV